MTYQLPSGTITELLTAYQSLADQTYDIFGSECDVIYINKNAVTPAVSGHNIPELNSINSHRRVPPNTYNINNQTVSSVEVSEKIKIKIYWNAKDWQSIYGYTSVPDNQVMFLAKLENSTKLNMATKVRFVDNMNNIYIFNRVSECVPYGFQKNRYCSSIWAQVQ